MDIFIAPRPLVILIDPAASVPASIASPAASTFAEELSVPASTVAVQVVFDVQLTFCIFLCRLPPTYITSLLFGEISNIVVNVTWFPVAFALPRQNLVDIPCITLTVP